MSDKEYSFAIKSTINRYADVDIQDQGARLGFLYDVDLACSDKQVAFTIFKTKLHVLPNMPEIMGKCQLMMEELKRNQEHRKPKWEVFAERKRVLERGTLKAKVEFLQKSLAKSEMEVLQMTTKLAVISDHDQKVASNTKLEEAKRMVDSVQKQLEEQGAAFNRSLENGGWTELERKSAEKEAADNVGIASQVTWERVMKKVLLQALTLDEDENDFEAKTALKQEIEHRLNAVEMDSNGSVVLAQKLAKEVSILKWGMRLFESFVHEINTESRIMSWKAQNRFLQCGDMSGYHIPVKDQKSAEGCMENIISLLKAHATSYGAQAHGQNIVAAIKSSGSRTVGLKNPKVTMQTIRSGNWEESHEVREPCDDDEEDTPAPKKPKLKFGKAEVAEKSLVAAVRPEPERKMTVHQERAQRDPPSDVERMKDDLERKLSKLEADIARVNEQADRRGRERERSPRPEYQRRERSPRPDYQRRGQDNGRRPNSNNDRFNGPSSNRGRGGRQGGFRDRANNVAAVESRGGSKKCSYNPCFSRRCPLLHAAGQSIPNQGKIKVSTQLRRDDRCVIAHEKGVCEPRCQMIHGKSNESAACCEALLQNAVCEDFFTKEGCKMNHCNQKL